MSCTLLWSSAAVAGESACCCWHLPAWHIPTQCRTTSRASSSNRRRNEVDLLKRTLSCYMISPMKNPANVVAAIGLALGGVFGLLGTIVTESNLRAASWGIDSVGLVVATALLSLKYFRNGNDIVAAGFLVFAIGEGVMLSGTATTLGRKRSFVCRGHGLVGSRTFAHQRSGRVRRLGPPGRDHWSNSLYHHGCENILG